MNRKHWGCKVSGCGREHVAKGLCVMHYLRILRHGKTEMPKDKYNEDGTCLAEDCAREYYSKGYCVMHYTRMTKHGNIDNPRPTIEERFHKGYVPVTETGCWIWEKAISDRGYGQIFKNNKVIPAHRLSWELHNGVIPDGLYVLHKCDVRCCVNPQHLFLGTQKDNIHDAVKKGRMNHTEMSIKAHKAKKSRREYINDTP